MALYKTSRRLLGSLLAPIKLFYDSAYRQVRTFKGVRNIRCNAFIRPRRQPTIRYRKGNYRKISQSSALEGLLSYQTLFPPMKQQYMDEFRLNGGYIAPITRYSGHSGMMKKCAGPMAGSWRWYAQAKEPSSPAAPPKGGPVAASGGRLGKLDAANESGFFHKVNKSRLEQIKQLLKEKSMLRGTEPGKKDK